MDYKHDKNPKKNLRLSYFKHLKENKKELEHFFSLNRKFREDKSIIDSDTYINNISHYLNSELSLEYAVILSIYKYEDHLEIDRSDLGKTSSFLWGQLHQEILELFSMVKIDTNWNILSSSTQYIDLKLSAISESNKYFLNFRKKESPSPVEFSITVPTELNLKLSWNDDYCLDLKSPYGEILSIWFCTRDYT
jgi:hypothetical protein